MDKDKNGREQLKAAFKDLLVHWKKYGKPTHLAYKQVAQDMTSLKKSLSTKGVFKNPPKIVTATIDDGFGMGISVINLFSEALGLETHFLGLYKKPFEILAFCQKIKPDFLGITVLQAFTEENIRMLSQNLPKSVKIISGGPVYKMDDKFAERAGVNITANNAGDYIAYMLDYSDERDREEGDMRFNTAERP